MAARKRARAAGYSLALWAMGIWWPAASGAGWLIEQMEYANLGAEGTNTIQYVAKQRLKTVSEGNAFIVDFPRHRFIAIDAERRVYWSGTVEEYLREVRAFQHAAHELARQRMAEALKDVGPQQRRALEEALQRRRGPPTSRPPRRRPHVTVAYTSETATMAGYTATKAMVYADGKPYQEVWLAKSLSLQGDLDLKRWRRLQSRLAKAVMAELTTTQAVEEDPAYEAMLERGYPVKIVELGEHGEPEAMTEVVRVEQRDIAEQEFQVPEGYRRIDLRQLFAEALDKLRRGE
jgi:broad specificity phosphatase PhoE